MLITQLQAYAHQLSCRPVSPPGVRLPCVARPACRPAVSEQEQVQAVRVPSRRARLRRKQQHQGWQQGRLVSAVLVAGFALT